MIGEIFSEEWSEDVDPSKMCINDLLYATR